MLLTPRKTKDLAVMQTSITKRLDILFSKLGKKMVQKEGQKIPFDRAVYEKCRDYDSVKTYLENSDLSEYNRKCYLCLFIMTQQNPIKAIKLAEELIGSNRDFAYGYALLGLSQRRVGLVNEACKNVIKAKKIQPDLWYTNTLWFLYEYLSTLQDAKEYTDILLFMNEVEDSEQTIIDSAEIHYVRSLAYADLGNHHVAWTEYTKGYKIAPEHMRAKQTRALLQWKNTDNVFDETVH